jgi:hypothetical protein
LGVLVLQEINAIEMSAAKMNFLMWMDFDRVFKKAELVWKYHQQLHELIKVDVPVQEFVIQQELFPMKSEGYRKAGGARKPEGGITCESNESGFGGCCLK